MHNVLLIEDNPGDARLIREMIAEDPRAPFTVHAADRLAKGLEHLSAGETALVILDLTLPDSHGLDTFAKVYAHSPAVPIIVLTGNDDDALALSAVKAGAQDYLVKSRLDRELMLNDQSNEEVIFRAMQRITAKVAEPLMIDAKEMYVTCSAGISLYPQDGRDVDTLLKNADAAMYRAKEHGRSNFQFYTSEMNERVNERLALENAMRRAIERKEFCLHYQQRVDLKSGAIVGAEALVRWMH